MNKKVLPLILVAVVFVVGGFLVTKGNFLKGEFGPPPESPPQPPQEFSIVHPLTTAGETACADTRTREFNIANPSDQAIAISRIGFYFQGEGFKNFSLSDFKLTPSGESIPYKFGTPLKNKSIIYFDLSPQALSGAGLKPLVVLAKSTRSVALSWKGNAIVAPVAGTQITGDFQVSPVWAKYGDAFAPAALPNGMKPLETIFNPRADKFIWTPFSLCSQKR